jgi:hypothetical protein
MGNEKLKQEIKRRWRKTTKIKGRTVWEKGVKKPNPLHLKDDFVFLDKATPYSQKEFGYNWEVRSNKRINPKTIYGKAVQFKSKKSAKKLVEQILKNKFK